MQQQANSATTTSRESVTRAALRAADILLLLGGAGDPTGVSELARSLDLSKAVVHRILRSLCARGLTAFDPKSRKYHLGPGAAAIGRRALQRSRIRQVALPVMRRLHDETQATVALAALVGLRRIHLDRIADPNGDADRMALGVYRPLYLGASGKAILAFGADDLRHEVLAALPARLESGRPLDAQTLRHEIERAALDGVATSHDEVTIGGGAVAAPLVGADGLAVGAITVYAPAQRFDQSGIERLKPVVRDAAARISAELCDATPEDLVRYRQQA